MPEIKTRDAVKGTIKAIDKSAVAAQSMKDTLVKAKEKAEHSTRAKESSPEEYAPDPVCLVPALQQRDAVEALSQVQVRQMQKSHTRSPQFFLFLQYTTPEPDKSNES